MDKRKNKSKLTETLTVRRILVLSVLLIVSAVVLSGCLDGSKEQKQKEDKNTIHKPSKYDNLAVNILVIEVEGKWDVNVLITLPNPCHKVEYVGKQKRGNEYYLDFTYTLPKPGEVCIQVLQNYNQTIELGTLEKGDYVVVLRINGQEVKAAKFSV